MKNKWNSDYLLLVLTNLVITVLVVFLVSSQSGVQGIPGSSGLPGSIGPVGPSGSQGIDGEDGDTPYIGSNGNWWIGSSDTGVSTVQTEEDGFNPLDYQTHYERDDQQAIYQDYRELNPVISTADLTYAQLLVSQGYVGITTAVEFLAIGDLPTGNFVLMNSIDFSGVSWAPIARFEGVLDGAGFSLLNLTDETLTISDTYRIALFSFIENAEIRNLTIDAFSFAFSSEYFGYYENALFASQVFGTTFSNITIINSDLVSFGDIALLAYYVVGTVFYDITIQGSTILGNYNVGGIVSDAEMSTFIGVVIDDSFLTIQGYNGGLVVGNSFMTLFDDISILNSMTMVSKSSGNTNYTNENIAIGFGNIELTIINDVDLDNSTIEVLDQGAQEGYYFYNLGGVVGYGRDVSLSNVVINDSDNAVVLFPEFEIVVNHPVIEYVGGVAGHLNGYVLLNIVNRATVDVLFFLDSQHETIEAVAGVLGYSAGQGYFYNVINEGMVYGSHDVGGVLGGVGYIQAIGHITMIQVANVGLIIGSENVGGIIGSIDGFTNLIIKHAFQHGDVFGAYNVGGLAGYLSGAIQDIVVDIQFVVVRGGVFGIDSVGGLAGGIYSEFYNPSTGTFTFSNIIVDNYVQSMLLGARIEEYVVIEFMPYYDGSYYFPNQIGLVFGYVFPTLNLSKIFVVQYEVMTPIFDLSSLETDTFEEEVVSGYYQPIFNRFVGEIFVTRTTNGWFNASILNQLFPSTFWTKTSTGFYLNDLANEPAILLGADEYHFVFKAYIFNLLEV
jgi:hypothetical protein